MCSRCDGVNSLYLFTGLYLAQLRPCGYSHLSLSIHRLSTDLSLFSMVWSVSLLSRWTDCSTCVWRLWMAKHLFLWKCSGRTPDWWGFFIEEMCLDSLGLSDNMVCPTYCFPHFLHWIRYTTQGVEQLTLWSWVLKVLLEILLLISLQCRYLEWIGQLFC